MAEPNSSAHHRPARRERVLATILAAISGLATCAVAGTFTPTQEIPLKLVGSSTAYPGGYFDADRLIDGDPKTEYASENFGTNTFCEVDFGESRTVAAFRHIDRRDRALVAASVLEFKNEDGSSAGTFTVPHIPVRCGNTFFKLPKPVTARRVVWRVAALGPFGHGTVGGAEIAFYEPGNQETSPYNNSVEVQVLPFSKHNGTQPVRVSVNHRYLEPAEATLQIQGAQPIHSVLKHGWNTILADLPAVHETTKRAGKVHLGEGLVRDIEFQQQPVRLLKIYVVPHSHVDIGYTARQSEVEASQIGSLLQGAAIAERTKDYPQGARFVWNVESLWVFDRFLATARPEDKARLLAAIRNGQIELTGMYLNELTGLCRPEELVQLFQLAPILEKQTGVPIRSAMISDAPGHTWGTVSAMAQASLKYLSTGPNYGERPFMKVYEDKPFYWVGPDGKSRVLVWVPFMGYALSHIYEDVSSELLEILCQRLHDRSYPYNLTYIRWAGRGDNGLPDEAICDAAIEWNTQYSSPTLCISGTTAPFLELENLHGKDLPEMRGDWTPYWEDGAASSARETALNRQSAERIVQAQALYAMAGMQHPKTDFTTAWQNVLLYSEHTWGASESISAPESQRTREQWETKKSYGDNADAQSRTLLDAGLRQIVTSDKTGKSISVINTLSWPRSELVSVSARDTKGMDKVLAKTGKPVASQRLTTGELVFRTEEVPQYSSRSYSPATGTPEIPTSPVRVEDGVVLDNGLLRVRVDPITGNISELIAPGISSNLVNQAGSRGLNDYVYVRGAEPDQQQYAGKATISIQEPGPLLAILRIESAAPGCKRLVREIRLAAGQDYVEIVNVVDKERLAAATYRRLPGKESVSFRFPFNFPEARMSVDLPLGVLDDDHKALPLSCEGWLTPGRWVNVGNGEIGVLWVSLDAPLVLPVDPEEIMREWRPDIGSRKQTGGLYSWIMNNRWGTNYRAYQEGRVSFRYYLRPHRGTDTAGSTRFSMGLSQPLLVQPGTTISRLRNPLFRLSNNNVVVSCLKPSDDGKACIVRLHCASGRDETVELLWSSRKPSLYLSNLSEEPTSPVTGPITVPGHGLVTLRANFN